MFDWLKRRRRARVLRDSAIPEELWQQTLTAVPLAASLAPPGQAALRDLVTLFLDEKDFYGADDLTVDPAMAAQIAAQACVPVIKLGIDALDGWYSVYVYPGQFRTRRAYRDQLGLVGEDTRVLAGEAQHTGGIVLSWEDVAEDIAYGNDGSNVVIHEIAHKLDMLNGDADGFPPLHREMSRGAWRTTMQSAYNQLRERVNAGHRTVVDPYAASEPAEFFAVTSEYFFEVPRVLRREMPDVYEQLVRFYRLDPAQAQD